MKTVDSSKIWLLTLLVSMCWGHAEVSLSEIKKNAHAIDLLVAQNFKKNGIAVPEYTDDETFIRRAFLVANGRIPNSREVIDFLEIESDQKRELMIAQLFKSDGYRSHLTNWYYDIFTLREGFRHGPLRIDNGRLIDYFRDAAATNKPWDEICREILTTKGSAHEGSGASGYHFKGDAIDDHLSNTMRIFTGVRLECAQCHDDPFQPWEQMEFYNLKAFIDGPTSNLEDNNSLRKIRKKTRELETSNPNKYVNNKIGKISKLHEYLLAIAANGTSEKKGRGETPLPPDYQYSDGEPGEIVSARSPFGKSVKVTGKSGSSDSLEKFAQWMTSDDTPEFAITIANRMWERVMGISLTPTTGDYVNPKNTNFPRLINKLAETMRSYDYDLKAFQQTLMSTRTFQFVSSNKDLKNGAKNALDGRRVNRMSAEQIWDSLLSLTVTDPDDLPKRPTTSPHASYAGQYLGQKSELAKMINKMTKDDYEAYLLETYDALVKGEIGMPEEGLSDVKKNQKGKNILRRASEAPTPAGGFLKVFGQSSREAAIDEASKEGTVSQALELLNGRVQKHIVHNSSSNLNVSLKNIKGDRERIKRTFLVVLSRMPDDNEMNLCLEVVKESKNKQAAYQNIVAGLIASQEFYFIF